MLSVIIESPVGCSPAATPANTIGGRAPTRATPRRVTIPPTVSNPRTAVRSGFTGACSSTAPGPRGCGWYSFPGGTIRPESCWAPSDLPQIHGQAITAASNALFTMEGLPVDEAGELIDVLLSSVPSIMTFGQLGR